LDRAREYLRKNKAAVKDKSLEHEKALKNWKKFQRLHPAEQKVRQESKDPGLPLKDFLEKAEQSKMKRSGLNGVEAFDIDPNHSHFIFADDGSLNFLPNSADTELRAAVQSCVAGVFKGVGVRQTGAGGKILQKIDDEITKMLRPPEKEGRGKGWKHATMPLVPEKNAKTDREMSRKTLRCTNKKNEKEECGRFFWGPPVESTSQQQQQTVTQTQCELCLRNEMIRELCLRNERMIKSRGEIRHSPASETFAPVQVHDLKHAITHKEDQIVWDVKEIQRYKDALKRYKSPEYLSTDKEPFETVAKVRHHELYIALLELFEKDVKCFQLMQRSEELGYFQGSLPELAEAMRDVEKEVATKVHKPPVTAKKKKSRADKAVSKEKRPVPPEVPMVCVCVEGGPNTIDTVLDAARLGTACLLVKDSGRAADWLSDAASLKDVKMRPKVLDLPQQAFMHFLEKDLGMKSGKDGFNYKELVSRLGDNLGLLKAYKEKPEIKDWVTLRERCEQWYTHEKDDPALSEAMRVEFSACQLVQKHYFKSGSLRFCVTDKMKLVIEAASTDMCQVC